MAFLPNSAKLDFPQCQIRGGKSENTSKPGLCGSSPVTTDTQCKDPRRSQMNNDPGKLDTLTPSPDLHGHTASHSTLTLGSPITYFSLNLARTGFEKNLTTYPCPWPFPSRLTTTSSNQPPCYPLSTLHPLFHSNTCHTNNTNISCAMGTDRLLMQ